MPDPQKSSTVSSRHQASANPGVYFLAVGVVLSLLVIFLFVPVVQWWAQPAPKDNGFDSRMPLSIMLQQGAMNGFTAVWFFAVGASFGSFMNVVSWRMPRRMNFVSQSSICPKCRHAIRGRHNLPVVGWIALGGRCYDCGEPISIRYPLVEIIFGAAAMILCVWEIAGGGWNLPFASANARSGFFETLWTPSLDLILLFAFHFCLFIWLFTLCLFELDEEAAPRRFAIVAILLAVVVSYVCPIVHPVSDLLTETASSKPYPFAPERFGGLAGLCFGAVILLPVALLSRNDRALPVNLLLAGALIGGHLGWHAVLSVVTISSVAAFLSGRRSMNVPLLAAAALLQILFWRWLHYAQWEAGILTTILWLLVAAMAIFILPAIPPDRQRPSFALR
jgi:prepilin signal peptidase PulO-like enzyme (type II secretory pathway)